MRVTEKDDADIAAAKPSSRPLDSSTSRLDSVYRLLLELGMLAALAYWGWRTGDGGIAGIGLAVLAVIASGAIWGVFAAPGDPSRHGRALVPLPGPVRLGIEFGLIGLAAAAVWTAGSRAAGETLLTAAGLHYALNWDRVAWLVRRPRV